MWTTSFVAAQGIGVPLLCQRIPNGRARAFFFRFFFFFVFFLFFPFSFFFDTMFLFSFQKRQLDRPAIILCHRGFVSFANYSEWSVALSNCPGNPPPPLLGAGIFSRRLCGICALQEIKGFRVSMLLRSLFNILHGLFDKWIADTGFGFSPVDLVCGQTLRRRRTPTEKPKRLRHLLISLGFLCGGTWRISDTI